MLRNTSIGPEGPGNGARAALASLERLHPPQRELFMSKIVSFLKVKATAAAVALALSLGTLMPAHAYTYADFHPIANHDYWRTFSVQVDGEPAAGALTKLKDRSAAFLFVRRHLILSLGAKEWHFNPNDEVAVTVTLDGENIAATARAVSPNELSVDVDRPFFKRLIPAATAVIQVNGEHWTLDLTGLADGLDEALGVMKKIEAKF
jgi:hypothetical protein